MGIDLGTTHSLCAVMREGRPVLIPNPLGAVLTPSAVAVSPEGRVLVGAPARELHITHPGDVALQFKRHMGSDWTYTLGKRTFTPVELSALVLTALRHDAEAFLGEAITEAVISVPAYFNDLQREATKQAGELAGFTVRRIVNEPTAAALCYGFHDRAAAKHLLVVDLGGGTFDVTLLEIFEGMLEIKATAGENFLGGEDFTRLLANEALKRQGLNPEIVERSWPQMYSRLLAEAETAKRKVVPGHETRLRVPSKDGTLPPEVPEATVPWDELLRAYEPLLSRVRLPVGKVLRDASLSPSSAFEVVLVGGASRMGLFQDVVRDMTGRELLCHHNPDEVVGLGAAVQAGLVEQGKDMGDLVVTDVSSHTLGIEVVKTVDERIMRGYFLPIIPRNTTIPVSMEEIVYTVHPFQTKLDVKIYQGEHRKIEGNLLLGNLEIGGIPKREAGQAVAVRFTYDLNGILEVEAIVEATGKKHATVLTLGAKSLGKGEVEKAVAKLQALKFYPRDDVVNHHLLAHAERVVGEVAISYRSDLEEAVDVFQRALFKSDRSMFAEIRKMLLIKLSAMGFPFDGVVDIDG